MISPRHKTRIDLDAMMANVRRAKLMLEADLKGSEGGGGLVYGCFQKQGYPKMDGLQGKTLLKWMIWGYHYFWKHPYVAVKENVFF